MSAPYYTNAYAGRISRIVPELIRSRELLFDLIWKDIRVRYRYAAMGLLWAIIEPLFMMLVLTFVFSFVFQLKFGEAAIGDGAGFDAVFILTGLVAWQFFSNSLTGAARCLVDGQSLITKVNFPREVLPLATVGTAFVNFVIGGILLVPLYLILVGIPPAATVWVIPVFAVQLVFIVGVALVLSSYNVTFRDIEYMTGAGLLFGFYATPIFYEPSMVRTALAGYNIEWLYPAYFINPMAGLVTAYREALFYGHQPALSLVAWPAACALAFLVLGVVVFRRRSGILADQL